MKELNDPKLGWLYRFHVYYTAANLINRTQTAIPGDKGTLPFRYCDYKGDNVTKWINIFDRLGVSSDGADYSRFDGPLGKYWDKEKWNMYWLDKTKNNKRVYLTERYVEDMIYDYHNHAFFQLYWLKQPTNRHTKTHKIVGKRHWYTDTYSYKSMAKNMYISDKAWESLIPDESKGITSVGILLLGKSLKVYTYCMYSAMTTSHGGNKDVIKEKFTSFVDSFIHEEKDRTSRDLETYYTETKKTLEGFEYMDGFLDSIDDRLIRVPRFILEKLKKTLAPKVELIKPVKSVKGKPHPLSKIKNLGERENSEMKIGTDFLILVGVLFGTAVYIWQR